MNFKVIGRRSRPHGSYGFFFCVRDTAATRGQYLALTKAWRSCFSSVHFCRCAHAGGVDLTLQNGMQLVRVSDGGVDSCTVRPRLQADRRDAALAATGPATTQSLPIHRRDWL